MALAANHALLLTASAISPEVADARGYWTATRPVELERWFGPTQRRLVPSLVIPTFDVRGEVVFCQLRPDHPRTVDGRVRKYELPSKARMAVDVPPAARAVLGDPKVPLVITEGARKADSAVSVGLYAVDLVGVWTWRGRNGDGGLTALADFEFIALKERVVYLIFDSDAMVKREVHGALKRFAAFLRKRGAEVRIVYLPSGDGGVKTGLDDYIAAGHDRDDVLALAVDELRPLGGDAAKKKSRAAGPALSAGMLLDRVRGVFARYLVLPEHADVALSLWTLHTWAFAAARTTPYLFIRSAEPESGKTRVLEVLKLVCRAPKRSSSITEAAVYQAVEAWQPTLLLDEVDNVFTGRGDREVALLAVLNDGYEHGGTAIRGTQEMEPREFSVFCPKAMSGIDTGRMPDTLRSRCIVISMQRRLASEPVQRFYPQDIAAEIEQLRDDLQRWAEEHLKALAAFRPEPMLEISDRADETWRLLLAVAHQAGGHWPAAARAAAVALVKAAASETANDRHLLLVSLKRLYADTDALSSKVICEKLNEEELLPFAGYSNGSGIKPRALALMLRPYGIKPKVVRDGAKTPRGYHRDQFEDAWDRYAPDPPKDEDASRTRDSHSPQGTSSSATSATSAPQSHADVADVADVASPGGGSDAHTHTCEEAQENGHYGTPEEQELLELWRAGRLDETEEWS